MPAETGDTILYALAMALAMGAVLVLPLLVVVGTVLAKLRKPAQAGPLIPRAWHPHRPRRHVKGRKRRS